jgi:hypothetical protein
MERAPFGRLEALLIYQPPVFWFLIIGRLQAYIGRRGSKSQRVAELMKLNDQSQSTMVALKALGGVGGTTEPDLHGSGSG